MSRQPSNDSPAVTRARSRRLTSRPTSPDDTSDSSDNESSFDLPPADVLADDLNRQTEEDSTDHENFLDSSYISTASSPYPSPLISDPDENEPAPSPPSPSLSRSPSLASSSSSYSGDLHTRYFAHYHHTMAPAMNGEATIVGLARAKDCPILTPGDVTPQLMLSWGRACRRYKQLNGHSDADTITHVGGSVQENHLQDWFAVEKERLTAGTLDEYLRAFAKHVLPKNWAHRIQEQILSSRQGEKEFAKWRVEILNLNSVLGMSDKIAPLDEKALRAQMTANLSAELRFYLANDTLDGIESFTDWALEIIDADERLCRDKARATRAASRAIAAWNGGPTGNGASSNGHTKKKAPLSDRLETPGAGTTERKYLPKLTEADKELLDAHKGCRRCRKFYAGHQTDACPLKATNSWPELSSYVPLTPALANTEKAAHLARANPGTVIAAVGLSVEELDQDLEDYFGAYSEDLPFDDETSAESD